MCDDQFSCLCCLRPFELFSECYSHEIELDIIVALNSDDWYDRYLSIYPAYKLFYDEIKKRDLVLKYASCKKYVKENFLDAYTL